MFESDFKNEISANGSVHLDKSEVKKPEDIKPELTAEQSYLFESRVILLNQPVDHKLAHMVNSKLLSMDTASKNPIYLFINSPGGEIYSGFAIFDMIRFIEAPVVTIVAGLAASMGSLLALAAPKERRFGLPNSKFLIHQPSVSSSGLGGSASDIEIHARDLIQTKEHVIEIYAKETGQSTETITAALDRDKWLTASQAKDFGLISQIVSSRSQIKLKN